MIVFNVNSGVIQIQDSVGKLLMNRILIMRAYTETVSCDSGMCEVVHGISLKVKRRCNDPEMLYFMNGNIEIAMDSNIYDLLERENLSVGKERNLTVERKHRK
jgi:hypothetical protein